MKTLGLIHSRHHRLGAEVHHPADDRSGRGHGRPGPLRRGCPHRSQALGCCHGVSSSNGKAPLAWSVPRIRLFLFV